MLKYYRPRTYRRKKLYYRKKYKLYGTKASFMPKTLSQKRYNSVSTKTFYFKGAGSLSSGATGILDFGWRTLRFSDDGAFKVPNVPGDFPIISRGYCEYKILAIRVSVFAANIGAELLTTAPPVSELFRGNTIIYKDQDINDSELVETDLTKVINYGSAQMIPSRVDKWNCVMYRPKGKNDGWGNCNINVDQADREPDSWEGGIFILTNNASPVQRLWFYQSTYKVIFRGRNYEG